MDTAYRMYDSSLTLNEAGQWLTACYLSGYIAECYCKLILESALSQGYNLTNSGIMWKHTLLDLKNEIALGIPGGLSAPYCVDMSVACSNIISGWGVSLRYAPDSHPWNNKQMADTIREEVDRLMEVILKMQLDGVIV